MDINYEKLPACYKEYKGKYNLRKCDNCKNCQIECRFKKHFNIWR